jgi:hypothetical protein
MADRRDIVDIAGVSGSTEPAPKKGPSGRPWLSIWFQCCNVYGRIYRNDAETAYDGRCPRCGAPVRAKIGRDGTTQRMFIAS